MKARPTPSDPLVALYRTKFLSACETDASPQRLNYCQCSEDALEARFTINQLNHLMKDPVLHEQIAAIYRTCAKSAGLALRRPRS